MNEPSSTRAPAVAGWFYPASEEQLSATLTALLNDAGCRATPARALVAPHAGYPYSGPIAAKAYGTLGERDDIERVLLLGPAHRVPVSGFALSPHQAFDTPLGSVTIDPDAYRELAAMPHVAIIEGAHREEHSLEVQLPFLQTVLGRFSLIPMLVGDTSPEQVAEVIEHFADSSTLIVVSSDLSHYNDYETARHIDGDTARAINNLDIAPIGPYQACGCRALNGLLYFARRQGWESVQLDLRNSGDTAGSRDSVVGYGAFCLR
jgi:AmmeMemoRadiSam system protein B